MKRAEELGREDGPTKEILTFYAKLLQSQKEADEFLRSRRGWLPSGFLVEDLLVLRKCIPGVLRTVEAKGPPPLSDEARGLLAAPGMVDEMLLEYWNNPSDTQFFAKAILQP